ncbi:pilus assembly protein [Brachybacterium sp. EF45031]|uniref:TadE family type IV pilus minor pilin n=1 Tax=Brachybacterium sillae TaxID=2810536 RepID=UPI00217DF657|nr:TadE family type IV pilus minor pilin [Brachybacterium sillae]MCS6712146.1 pilus assembly protein [Brachybacterium sillae]
MTARSPRSFRACRRLLVALREDRGTATAETAIVLPVVVVLCTVLLIVGAVLAQQVQVESAARAAARELARGESVASAEAAAHRIAGPDTRVSVSRSGPWVEVTTTRRWSAPPGVLHGLSGTLTGHASARLEPQLLPEGSP